ncbi:sigma-54-dependent transcriptional regulator [candidate division KSB1 bacterium]
MITSQIPGKILIVDDTPDTLEMLNRNLSSKGYQVFQAENVNDALSLLETTDIDLVITDYKMPGASGLDLIRHVNENYKEVEIMMITGYPSIDGAVEAVKTGAENYLSKPFTKEELNTAVNRAFEKLVLRRKNGLKIDKLPVSVCGLIGESEAMKKVMHDIGKAASTTATVLITGDSGTGKELVSREIHYKSRRSTAAFVPVNCGGIPDSLLESELFGHIKGSFTGATESRAGFFQTADGGSIFLDEISETSIAMQVKLLRVLQDKEVYMVGSRRPQKVDVRIIAATNKNLETLIQKGMFREDLYYRLNVITIDLPPLREREDDVILFAHYFSQKFSRDYGVPKLDFTDKALEVMKNYEWPGNVRELENLIQRLVVMGEAGTISVPDLPPQMRYSSLRETGLKKTLAEIEIDHIRNVLASVNENKTLAAEILGIDRKTLRKKLAATKPPDDSHP